MRTPIKRLGLKNLPAAEREQLSRQIRCSFGSQGDLLRAIAGAFINYFRRTKNGAVALDDGQDVVKIMGDSAGELPDRLHFFRKRNVPTRTWPLR